MHCLNLRGVWRHGRPSRLALLLTTALAGLNPSSANQWTGTTGDWFDTANWDTGVPDASNFALINNGGTANIENGGSAVSTAGILGESTGSIGTINVNGPGSTWTNSGGFSAGTRGTGTLDIRNGGSVSNGATSLGDAAGGVGHVIVAGSGSNWTTSYILLGYRSTGTLDISSGASVGSTNVTLGSEPTGRGTVTVSGTGSSWTLSGMLEVANQGVGVLNIRDGASVSATGANGVRIATNAGAAGTIAIGGLEDAAAASAGTLTATKVDFGNGTGKLVFNHTDANYVFNAPISKNGTINHLAGTTVLTGDSSGFTGTTNLTGGHLVVGNGTSGTLGGTLIASSGATLSGTGILGGTTISAGATHAPGNSIGTQTVNGNYVNHGTLVIEASPVAADRLVVNGTVDITNATLDLQLSGLNWEIADSPYVYTIIANDGADAVTGAFAISQKTHLFLKTALNYAGGDGNDVDLSIARNKVSFASYAANDEQSGIAQAIENQGSGAVFDALVALDDADVVQQSFAALLGDIRPTAGTTLVRNGVMLGQTVNNRLQAAPEPADGDFTPILAYGPGGPELAAPNPNLGAVWATAFGGRGSIEGTTALDTGSAGLAAGLDGKLGEWRLGLLAGYSNSSFTATNGAARGGSDSYSVGLYGGTEWGDVAFRTSLAYSWHDVSTNRSVSFGGFTDQLSARYGAHALQASGELAYTLDIANGASFEPFANLTHVRLATDGYTESGGAAALTSTANVSNTTFATLGIRASQKFAVGTVLATVNGMVGWEHGMGDLTPTNTSSFAGSSAFTVTGAPTPEDTALVSAGVDLNLSEAATIGFTYDGRFARGNYNNGVTAKVKILF